MVDHTMKRAATLRNRLSAASGRCEALASQTRDIITQPNQPPDQAPPETTLDHYPAALAALNTARREITLAAGDLWKRVEA